MTQSQMLEEVVAGYGVLYGALEELRELLAREPEPKWQALAQGISRVLAKADESKVWEH